MKNNLLILSSILIILGCGKDNETTPTNVSAPKVTSIQVLDISNNGNATDLEVAFSRVSDESSISGYRVYVVRTDEQASFDLAATNNIEAENYLALPSDGSNKQTTFNQDSKDSGGRIIAEEVEYVIFILSVADGMNATLNSLSNASAAITLTEVLVSAPSVGTVRVADVGNNANGTDLEITFSRVSTESLISEYRVFVVQSASQSSFDLSVAESAAATNYSVMAADGSDKKNTLEANSNDSEGNVIVESIEYVVYVMSVADGANAMTNSLSSPSSTITLEDVAIVAPGVNSVRVDDIGNNVNGTDLEVMFDQASDESLISEYRVFAVRSESQSAFDLTVAESAVPANYVAAVPDGSNKVITLDAGSNDSDGQLITDCVEYVVFVMSVSDGTVATINSLSIASSKITLKSIKITYIGNDGVHITDGQKSVIIDALPFNTNGWRPLAPGLQSIIEQGTHPYDNISAAMITHNHSDHLGSTSMTAFLQSNPSASLLAPSQVRGGISAGSGQIQNFTLSLDTQTDLVIDGIPIRVMRIRHFTPTDGSDFSSSESLAFLIELGGKKILHIGDGDLSGINFNNLGLENENIDVALLPTFNFSGQLTTTNRDVVLNKIAPANIIGLHLASGTAVSAVTNIYPDATVFTTSLQFVQY